MEPIDKKKVKSPKHLWVVFLHGKPMGVVCCRDGNQCIRKLVRAMGFKNKIEYMKAFPDMYRTEKQSSMMRKIVAAGHNTNAEKGATYFKDYVYRYLPLKNIATFSQIFKEHNGFDLFVVRPTLYEARTSRGFRKTKYKYLWFCKDWKGEDGQNAEE